jgi:hypothetical protein
MKLVNPLPPDASFLYHYTTTDTVLNHILKNGTLKFNSFRKVNDPRESKEWDMTPFVSMDSNLDLDQYHAISREVSDILKANAKLVCFSCDKNEAIGKLQPEALLYRGFSKPSMWHHYGGKHNGLCLMFDREKLNNTFIKRLDQSRLVSGKVHYSNQGILTKIGNDPFNINLTTITSTTNYLSAIKAHLNSWFSALFLRKLTDWANEDEYRWIYLDTNPEPIYVDFEDSLEAIVIGEHVSDVHSEDILRHCVEYHADVANLNWQNGFPKIEHPGQPYITHKHLLDEEKI